MYRTEATPKLPCGYPQKGERRRAQPRTTLRRTRGRFGCDERIRDAEQKEEEGEEHMLALQAYPYV